jgi:hypothetical protein
LTGADCHVERHKTDTVINTVSRVVGKVKINCSVALCQYKILSVITAAVLFPLEGGRYFVYTVGMVRDIAGAIAGCTRCVDCIITPAIPTVVNSIRAKVSGVKYISAISSAEVTPTDMRAEVT